MSFFINLNNEPRFKRPELLYHPPIPPALHGVNPRTLMGKKRWDEVRREAFEKNNDCCWCCGVHVSEAKPYQRLEGHEIYDINYKKGKMKLREIVGLCPMCHMFIHKGRLAMLVEAGKRQRSLLNAVIAHGSDLIWMTDAKPWWNTKKVSDQWAKYMHKHGWRDWYLEFEGKKYHSRFKTPLEHEQYYARLA